MNNCISTTLIDYYPPWVNGIVQTFYWSDSYQLAGKYKPEFGMSFKSDWLVQLVVL